MLLAVVLYNIYNFLKVVMTRYIAGKQCNINKNCMIMCGFKVNYDCNTKFSNQFLHGNVQIMIAKKDDIYCML